MEKSVPEEKYTIPDKQRELVEIERKNIKEIPNYLLDWDEVENQYLQIDIIIICIAEIHVKFLFIDFFNVSKY